MGSVTQSGSNYITPSYFIKYNFSTFLLITIASLFLKSFNFEQGFEARSISKVSTRQTRCDLNSEAMIEMLRVGISLTLPIINNQECTLLFYWNKHSTPDDSVGGDDSA